MRGVTIFVDSRYHLLVEKQVFEVPVLGYLVDFISTKTGFATFLGVIAFFIIIAFVTTPPAKVKLKEKTPSDGIVRGRRINTLPKHDEEDSSKSHDQ